GVDCLGATGLGRRKQRRDAQVALVRGRRADAVRLVGKAYMQRVAVDFGVDGDGSDTQLLAGADQARGDLSAVGDEDTAKHRLTPRLGGASPGTLVCPPGPPRPYAGRRWSQPWSRARPGDPAGPRYAPAALPRVRPLGRCGRCYAVPPAPLSLA